MESLWAEARFLHDGLPDILFLVPFAQGVAVECIFSRCDLAVAVVAGAFGPKS
jgi:hypothetical protein